MKKKVLIIILICIAFCAIIGIMISLKTKEIITQPTGNQISQNNKQINQENAENELQTPQQTNQEKEEINQTVEKNGVKVTLKDVEYNNGFIKIGYKFEVKDIYEKPYELEYYNIEQKTKNKDEFKKEIFEKCANIQFQAKIFDENNNVYIGNYEEENSGFNILGELKDFDKNYNINELISDDEFMLYMVSDISSYKFENNINIQIKIKNLCMEFMGDNPSIFDGEWNFNVNNLRQNAETMKRYVPKDAVAEFEVKKEYGWAINSQTGEKEKYDTPIIVVPDGENGKAQITQIKTSEIGTVIEIETNLENGIMVDESIKVPRYAFDLIDNQGNMIEEKESLYTASLFYPKIINDNSTYTMKIYKYYTDQFSDTRDDDTEYENVKTISFNILDTDLVSE